MTLRAILPAITIAALTILAYSGSFDGDFVSDDVRGIQHNELLSSLDWAGIERIFATYDPPNYIPITYLSFAADIQIFGPEPFGFHVTNLIFHIACALLFHQLLLRFRIPPAAAFLAALVWAVHPLNVESVAFMSERKNVLSTFFFLLAFFVFLDFSESGRWRLYVGGFVLTVLAVLSKMNTMVLPAVWIAYEATVRFRVRLRDVLASLPLLAVGAAVALYTIQNSRVWAHTYHGGSAVVTGLTSATVIFRYLRRIVVPTGLSDYYPVPLRGSVLDPVVSLSLLGLLALFATFVWLVVTRRPQGFWFAWFFITLSPMLNLVPFPTLMQDRYMYVPMMGVLALVADVCTRIIRSPLPRRMLATATTCVALIFTAMTHSQVEAWTSPLSLWESRHLSQFYLPADRGRSRAAFPNSPELASLRRALINDPTSPVLHNNLGALLYEAGDLATAKRHLEQAERFDGDSAAILLNLGRTYRRLGDLDKAAKMLERAIAADPYSLFAHINLARVYLAQGNAATARKELDAAARVRPNSTRIWSQELAQLERLESATQ